MIAGLPEGPLLDVYLHKPLEKKLDLLQMQSAAYQPPQEALGMAAFLVGVIMADLKAQRGGPAARRAKWSRQEPRPSVSNDDSAEDQTHEASSMLSTAVVG